MQIFHKMKYGFKGHPTISQKVIFVFRNQLFLIYLFSLKSDLIYYIYMNTQIFHKIEYDAKGHGRSHKALLAKFVPANSFINRF